MKKLVLLTVLLVSIVSATSVQAQTVHRWNKELNNMCSEYVSTDHTPRELYNCLIQNTRDYYIWRHGWEEKVEVKDIMGVIAIYQPDILNISLPEKQRLAQYYNKELPKMYKAKMEQRKNLDVKFTQADVNRIKNAKI